MEGDTFSDNNRLHTDENKNAYGTSATFDRIALVRCCEMIELDGLLASMPFATSVLIGAALGAVVGSYLATIYNRWPRAESTAGRARSLCDHCKRQLRWYELVPVGSWIILRGRCRTCHAAISPLFFGIEVLCALHGAAAFGFGMPLLAPFLWLLLILAVFDARLLWLPDRLVLALALAALVAPAAEPGLPFTWRLAAGAGALAILWLLAAAYRRLRGREGLGGGDAKLFGAIALWSGPIALPAILLLACAIGLGDAGRRVVRGANAGTVALPFGTYLAAATILFATFKLLVFRLNGGV